MDILEADKNMPRVLQDIIADFNNTVYKNKSAIDKYLDQWNLFAGRIKKEVPEITAEDENRTLRCGELSPGCVLCKKGKWDCIFITMDCNLDCGFCYSPGKAGKRHIRSAFGDDLKSVSDTYSYLKIRGVGFTGGEPLMEFASLLSWFRKLKSQLPDNYFWIYTNGLLLNEKYVDILSENGLDEIRFNLAAIGYNNPDILSIVKYASKKISKITVEIPAIQDDRDILISSLSSWVSAGVKYLNLHELISEPGSNSQIYNNQCDMLTLSDGHKTGIVPESKLLIADVIKYVKKHKLPLNINVCSLSNKLKQIRDRRNNFARLLKKSYERITDEEFLETVLVYKDSKDFRYVNPEAYRVQDYKSWNAVRLIKFAPLSVNDNSNKYLSVSKIK